jgi:hypothetical protein
MPRRTINTASPDPAVIEMRHSLAQRITALAGKAGEQSTAIPGLFLYYRATTTARRRLCYRASYEPSLSVFVQGRKRIFPFFIRSVCSLSSRVAAEITRHPTIGSSVVAEEPPQQERKR